MWTTLANKTDFRNQLLAMPISTEERRFIRNWEEQRKGGKATFVAIYTFGYFIILFMMGVAFGLFSGLRFISIPLISGLAAVALVGAVVLSFWQWQRHQKKFARIIQREITEGDQQA